MFVNSPGYHMLGKCQSLSRAILVVVVVVFYSCLLLLLSLFKFRYTKEKQRKQDTNKTKKKPTALTGKIVKDITNVHLHILLHDNHLH